MADMEKVIKGLKCCCGTGMCFDGCPYHGASKKITECISQLALEALDLLKEQGVVKPKNIPEELKQKMWNALYAEEDKFEKKYVGTKEHNSWFFIYRSWLQEGFNLAIKAIADWKGQ